MIVLIGGEKGGTGKTTLATNLAVMRIVNSGDVLLVDADPQPNASYWCTSRDQNKITPRVPSVQKTGKNTQADIRELKNKFKDIVIDTGGRDSIELRASLLVSNIAIIPLRPSQFDLWTLAKINNLVGEVRQFNETLRVLVCLNQIPTNPMIKEVNDAKNFFNSSEFEHISLANSALSERVAFRKVAISGMTVHEAQIDAKAENELDSLYKEIFNGY
jgi:chromosome partitioning protein